MKEFFMSIFNNTDILNDIIGIIGIIVSIILAIVGAVVAGIVIKKKKAKSKIGKNSNNNVVIQNMDINNK